jgi:phosphatidyl-myo-inositol dimannoside synthase
MTTRRSLVLVSDAFGGRGGIALYNRNLLQALCAYPSMERVVAIPRVISYKMEEMPDNLDYRTDAIGGLLKFIHTCVRIALSESRFDLIICGHLHLLPFARMLGIFYRCPVIPIVYGVEAWTPTSHKSVNRLCRELKTFISIRHYTAQRLIEWAKPSRQSYYYLPNCIDESKYGIMPRNPALMGKYNLNGKCVILTTGRLDNIEVESNKGFDEVIEVLPELRKKIPNLVYLILGDGADIGRLKVKAKSLGVDDMVIFTGYVQDVEKADHYRLADVFAMPGRNPKFDRYPYRFVFLEALACGIPVVGAKLEDSWDLNDPDSQLIIQVDPNSKEEILQGILAALSQPKGVLPEGIERFYYGRFMYKFHEIITDILSEADVNSSQVVKLDKKSKKIMASS